MAKHPALTARSWLLALAASGALGACATVGPPPPGAPRDTVAFRGVPGFDTSIYPGDSTLARWRTSSPYRWVGYYLPSPCHTDNSWVGRRGSVERTGLGVAVIFMGEQDWGAAATVAGPTKTGGAAGAPATGSAARCTRTNLTAVRGKADAVSADSAMAAEGFPAGSHIYLDVEPVDSVSAALVSYVIAWMDGVLDRGRYLPAVYAHARNADSLRAVQVREYGAKGNAVPPRFWVAGGPAPFDLHYSPAASAVTYANIWQGISNVTQSWAGKALRIDVNVADTPSPSGPGAGAAAGPGPAAVGR